ncbi:hypothetical protein THRCLA_20539 [Thraustotheca clavata]|uniref:RecA family profile 1 domain-containing protein n=1 Tax=Thraustotheca clavata TaxID=74557 RepID=A0A1W0A632_9STRA|nr:hypothetical protein THRCLA_20539 [Thraustotheca clavata]
MWSLDETALELVQRAWYDAPFKTGISAIDQVFPEGIPSRSVLEIYGDAISPKSLMLMHIVAAFLLSNDDAIVFYFDIESMFDAEEMRNILLARMRANSAIDMEKIMLRLVMFHPNSSRSFGQDLQQAHEELIKAKRRSSSVLVAIDAIGTFHFIDKAQAIRVGEALTPTIFSQLKEFARTHTAFIIATKSNDAGNGWSHTEYLPPAWTSQVTKRIYVRTRTSSMSTPQWTFQLKYFVQSDVYV